MLALQRKSHRLAFAAGLFVSTACSTTPVRVQVQPASLEMKSVQVEKRRAKPVDDSPGVFVAGIATLKEGQSRPIEIVATSVGGVTSTLTETATASGANSFTIRMPAEVKVSLSGGKASEVYVDAERLPQPQLPLSRTIDAPDDGREIVVMARSEQGVAARKSVTVRPGVLEDIVLDLDLAARLKPVAQRVPFGAKVTFDGSNSSPTGSIAKFIWDFGDGSGPIETSSPTIEHTYEFKRDYGAGRQFSPGLTIVTVDGVRTSTSTSFEGYLDRATLEVAVSAFPADPYLRVPGQPIQFCLTPKTGYRPADIVGLRIDFGDGQSATQDANGAPLALTLSNGQPTPLLVQHAYASTGRFEPRLSYTHASIEGQGPFQADLTPGEERTFQIEVSPAYLSSTALLDAAWNDVYRQLKGALDKLDVKGAKPNDKPKFVLASLDSADPSKVPGFSETADRVTRMMVADGVQVMERSSNVLARLAPEALVDISRRVREGNTSVDETPSPADYREYLDYGLETSGGVDQDLKFGVRVEGTSDRLVQSALGNDGTRKQIVEATQAVGTSDGRPVPATFQRDVDNIAKIVASRNLPVLAARFDTADFLLALRFNESPQSHFVFGYKYDAALRRPLALQSREVSVDLRVLDRSGRILDSRTLRGTASQLVAEEYAAALGAESAPVRQVK